jgi:hypothetical protein
MKKKIRGIYNIIKRKIYFFSKKKNIFRPNKKQDIYESYNLNDDYKNRVMITTEKPRLKLNAYCINLQTRKKNMDFIRHEWKEFLNVTRFIALNSTTNSHKKLLCDIWNNKDNEKFPIVVMEDDVYRRQNFTKYWNKLLDLTKCDYVAFDAFYLKFKPYQEDCHHDFVSLMEHRATGFTVYYKCFFDRFETLEDLYNVLSRGTIDLHFTHNTTYINYTPKEQVCRQIVSKISTRTNKKTNHYLKHYNTAEKKLNEV